MDCPDTCSLEVAVTANAVERIRDSRSHAATNGFICSKVARFGERLDHPRRLLRPMRRAGPKGSGRFAPISWPDALAEISSRFQRIVDAWGGEAILPYHYGGSNGFLTDGLLDRLFFARLGASRLALTICAAPTGAVATGMYGKMPGVAFDDYVHSECVVIWGANPKASNIHLVPFLREAKQRGAFVAVVDPRQNFSASEVDLHLPVLPGTDLPVALSMIRLFHEEGYLDRAFLDRWCDGLEPLLAAAAAWPVERAAAVSGVPAQDIRRLAGVYAERSPAVIRCGWGVERNRNGGQAVAAILAMPALVGKFAVRAGGYTLSNTGALRFDPTDVLDVPAQPTRIINMTELGAVLHDDVAPIKGLFVYNCNPAATVPDQNAVLRGLAREDLFSVVFDQVMTDTAVYADLLLPATTFLEHWDLRRGYGNYVVGAVRPVIAPRGEAKSNVEVFAALGRAMGWSDDAFHWDDQTAFQRVAQSLQLDVDALREGQIISLFREQSPVQFGTIFPGTSDGKVHLTPSELGPKPYVYNPVDAKQFPLALISPATSKMISSTLGEFNFDELFAELHPGDARRLGIGDGDRVRVYNDLGEVICRARVGRGVRAGVVYIPKGAWRHSSENGQTSTALCPATLNVVGGGACFNDARVAVERVGRTS